MINSKKTLSIFKEESKFSIKLALPMILGQIGQVALGLVDTVMVGKIGIIPLAGVTFGSSLMLILIVIGANLCTAVHVLVSRNSNNDYSSNILLNGLKIGLLYSFFIALMLNWKINFLNFFGQDIEVMEQARPYVIYNLWSLIPFMLFICFRNYSEAKNHLWPSFMITILGIVINIFFNWIFIFGFYPIPAMGSAGAGLATLIARIIMLVVMVTYIFSSNKFILKWSIVKCFYFDVQYIKSILFIGLPVAFQGLFGLGFLFTTTVMMGWLGPNYLAAHQIALNYSGIIFMIPLGLSFALSIRIGNAIGNKNPEKARNIAYSGVILSGIIMSFFSIFTLFAREYIYLFFISDQIVIDITYQIFLVVACFQVVDGVDITALGSLKGLADVKAPAIIVILTHWLLGLSVAYIMGFIFNYKGVGVWLGLFTAALSCATLVLLRLMKVTKINIQNLI